MPRVIVPLYCLLLLSWACGEDGTERARQTTAAQGSTADTLPTPPPVLSSLSVLVNNARLLVVDPEGRRTGRLAEGREFRDIPESTVFVDRITAPSFTVTVLISPPADGAYRVIVAGVPRDGAILTVNAYSSDGSRQPLLTRLLTLAEGSGQEFELHFRSDRGATLRLEPVERSR